MPQWSWTPHWQWMAVELGWTQLMGWARRPRAPAPDCSAGGSAAGPPARLSEWELQKRFNRFQRKAERLGLTLRRIGGARRPGGSDDG
jgi:hypothetical protein